MTRIDTSKFNRERPKPVGSRPADETLARVRDIAFVVQNQITGTIRVPPTSVGPTGDPAALRDAFARLFPVHAQAQGSRWTGDSVITDVALRDGVPEARYAIAAPPFGFYLLVSISFPSGLYQYYRPNPTQVPPLSNDRRGAIVDWQILDYDRPH